MQMSILYGENPKDSTRKLLEPLNKFSKVAGYEINAEKSFALLTLAMSDLKKKLRKQPHLQ